MHKIIENLNLIANRKGPIVKKNYKIYKKALENRVLLKYIRKKKKRDVSKK